MICKHKPLPFYPGGPHAYCETCRSPMNRDKYGKWHLAPVSAPLAPACGAGVRLAPSIRAEKDKS